MATVDQLDIKINASAADAVRSINQLCGCLDNLQKKLNLDISRLGLGKISAETRNITNSLQALNSIKKVDFSNIFSGISKIQKTDGKKISETANSLRMLAGATSTLNSTNFDNRNITSLINATARLSKIDTNTKQFEKLGRSLEGMVNSLASAKDVPRITSTVVGSISRLANAGTKTNEAARALPLLKTNLNSLINTLSKAPAVTNANELVSSIGRLASAGSRTKQTADNLDYLSVKLQNFIQSLKNVPAISPSTIKLVSAVASLTNAGKFNIFSSTTSSMNKFGSATKSLITTIGSGLGNAFKAAGSGVSSFTTRLKQHIPLVNSVSKSTDTLIGKLGRLYITYYSLRRIGHIFSGFVTSASDYIEEYNYFHVSVDKIAEESKEDYKKYGYNSAKEYADSFRERLTELTTKMSGFKIGENGELFTSAKIKNLGLDVTEITNFESRIMQMTNSVGMIGEASIAASKGLTMLAGDMSSLANVKLETVMNNFSSGLAGASTALKKYGIDTSVSTLKQTALSLGIKKNISNMTQAEKEYLRVIVMINQSKVAWGDLANTINQPANQFRMLQNSLKQISTLIGNLFMPVIQKVMPYINAMANAVKDLLQWISDLFGLKWTDTSVKAPYTSEFESSYDDLVSDAEDAADAIDDAADAQKKFNKQLQSFDELNNLTTTKSKDKDKDKDDDKNADVSGILSDALIAAVEDYEKRWNKAFKSMRNDVEELTKKIEDLFTKAWETGDGSGIGEALAEFLDKGIDWVNEHTDQFSDGLNKIASILGTGLNGAVEKFNFEGLGAAVGNLIKAALEAQETFFDMVDWTNLGSNLATSLNTAIETGVLEQYFKTMASKIRAAIETAFGAVTTFKFKNLGAAIGRGINDFIDKMNIKDPKTKLNGWQMLGKSIGDIILGFGDMIITALNGVDWEAVGQAIADFITSIDWGGIIWKLGEVVKSFAKALKKTLTGAGVPKPLSNLIVNVGIGGWIIKKLGKSALGAAIVGKLGKKFAVALLNVGAIVKSWLAKGINKTGLVSKISKAVGKVTTTLKNVGAKITSWIANSVNKTGLKAKIIDKIGKITTTFKNIGAVIKGWLPTLGKGGKVKDLISGIKTALGIAEGGAFSIGAIKTALSLKLPKLPTFVFPDPGTDDLVRQFDQWLYHALGDKDFVEFTVDIVLKIGKFIGNIGEQIQEAFNTFMTGGEGGTPSINALVNYFTKDKEPDQKYSSGGGKSFDTDATVKYKADTSEIDKVTADDKNATVYYKTNTKELEAANKMADADHENTTTFKTEHKELDKIIKKALEDLENVTKFGTDTDSLDAAIAKATKDRNNTTTFKGKEGKSLQETIEKAEATHTSNTKFYADPTIAFKNAVKQWEKVKKNSTITATIEFKAVLDKATKDLGSAAVTNMPWNKHAKGSTGLPTNELGIVNDQAGSTYKELIIPPNGKPFIPDGRNVILAMQKGTKVIPADKTKKLLNSLPHFANGTEDFDSDKKSKGGNSIAAGVSQALEDTIMPYIKEIVRALNNGGSTTVATSGKKTTTKYSDTVKEIQKAWTNLAKWFESTVVEPIEKVFETMKEKLLGVFDSTHDEMSKKYEEYSKSWQDTLKEIPGWISDNIGDAITSNFEEFCSDIKESLSSTWEDMQDILSPIPDWLESNITNPFSESFSNTFGDVENEHNRMWDIISTYASGKINWIDALRDASFTRFSYLIEELEKKLDVLDRDIRDTENVINNTSNRISEVKRQAEEVQNTLNDVENQKTVALKSEFVSASSKGKITGGTEYFADSISQVSHNVISVLDNTNDAIDRFKNNLTSKVTFKRYATGGFPEDGWFRASKGEIMGRFDNGQSVVANNQQITDGIAMAVQEANQESNMLMRQELNLLQRQNDLLMGILEKETGITQKDLFNAVRSEDSMFRKRTGRSAFGF